MPNLPHPPPNILLTGASRGIGHATVQKFSNCGWRIITCSREDIPSQCQADPNWTHHIPADLSALKGVKKFIADATKILNGDPLHALVNNAAISPKDESHKRLGCLNGDLQQWRAVFELNLFTPLALSRAFRQNLQSATPKKTPSKEDSHNTITPSIINITSIAGHRAHPFAGSAYATSKAALSALTRELAMEFAPLGVRVNAIAPGEIQTAMITPEYDELIARIPMQRLGSPTEVANAVYQICSSDFSYVTGSEIFLTGGQHLM